MYLLQQILSSDSLEDILFTCFLNFSTYKTILTTKSTTNLYCTYQKLIKHKICLLVIKNDVKLANLEKNENSTRGARYLLVWRTYTSKVLVKKLNISMNYLESNQFIIFCLNMWICHRIISVINSHQWQYRSIDSHISCTLSSCPSTRWRNSSSASSR